MTCKRYYLNYIIFYSTVVLKSCHKKRYFFRKICA